MSNWKKPPLFGVSTPRLRKIVESLKSPGRGETKYEKRVRLDAYKEALGRLGERGNERALAEWSEPLEERARTVRARHVMGQREVRERLQAGLVGWEEGDVPEPADEDVPSSPALQALARTADDRMRDQAWSNYTPEGWSA